ncbi:hypothetical protein [Tenacibaculum maritimum]|uniref:hypothetical protein n=1 Tax=Tenacibaculum maritimum TaxID=107401 RepID=UPI0013309588|nr:hypothetical protein [Tenacibaculum maritimum]
MKLSRLYLVVFISCISCNSKSHRVAIQELVPTEQIAKEKIILDKASVNLFWKESCFIEKNSIFERELLLG